MRSNRLYAKTSNAFISNLRIYTRTSRRNEKKEKEKDAKAIDKAFGIKDGKKKKGENG
jgi:hypothetical protein